MIIRSIYKVLDFSIQYNYPKVSNDEVSYKHIYYKLSNDWLNLVKLLYKIHKNFMIEI